MTQITRTKMRKAHAQYIMRLERDEPGPAHHGHIAPTTRNNDPKDVIRSLIYEQNASQNSDSANAQDKETDYRPAVPHDVGRYLATWHGEQILQHIHLASSTPWISHSFLLFAF
jgi:hypothetical protein